MKCHVDFDDDAVINLLGAVVKLAIRDAEWGVRPRPDEMDATEFLQQEDFHIMDYNQQEAARLAAQDADRKALWGNSSHAAPRRELVQRAVGERGMGDCV